MSKQKELEDFIKENKILNVHFDKGPEARYLTAEQFAEECLEALKRSKERRDLPKDQQMLLDIKHAYEQLSHAIKLTQWNFREDPIPELTPERRKLLKCFGYIESAQMSLGNWVRNESNS